MKGRLLCITGTIVSLIIHSSFANAQGTAFTYQGRLNANGNAANGTYNLTFSLYTANTGGASVAGPVTNNGVAVSNGLFMAAIDFGSGAWNGQTNWLQIGVETNGASPFTTLTPRQQLTPTPYAIFAESISGLTVYGDTNGAPNLVGGSLLNYVSGGTIGATIGGGGAVNFMGNAYSNSVTGDFGTVGGGLDNVAGGDASTIAGGQNNQATGNYSFVGGGRNNDASGFVAIIAGGDGNAAQLDDTFIGGGWGNVAGNLDAMIGGGDNNAASGVASTISGGEYNNAASDHDFVGGGEFNLSSNSFATVSGGENNTATNNNATVGGGIDNVASGFSSTVAGGGDEEIEVDVRIRPPAGLGGVSLGNTASGDFSAVGGGYQNTASGNSSTVAGGHNNNANADQSVIGGGENNVTSDDHTTVAGGLGNNAGGQYAFIGGGQGNNGAGAGDTIVGGFNNSSGGGNNSTIVGGANNNSSGSDAFIGAGGNNSVSGVYATIGGGSYNSALIDLSFVGGGSNNMSAGYAATIPGGENNIASGQDSFAGGNSAQATNDNSFVWSDGSTNTDSTTNNQFVARAGNGFIFYTSTNTVTGVMLAAGGTSWATLSDRNAKKDFAPVNAQAVLDKLATVPIEQWHYKWEKDSDVPNIGPMAQDFKHAFYPGRNDKSITTLEFDGVELAAIQGLNQKLTEQQAENKELKQELNELKAEVKLLENRN